MRPISGSYLTVTFFPSSSFSAMVRAMDRNLRQAVLLSIVAFVVASAALGCHWGPQNAPKGESLLKPVGLAEDGVQLEIISVHFSQHDDELNGSMWKEIDEQQLPTAARRALAENGFRVGMVNGQLPPALMRLLTEAEKKPATITEAAARLEQTSPVSRQQMQLHSGWKGEIIASNIYPEVPLFTTEQGSVSGHTYRQAQGILAAKTKALGDQRVTVCLTPELQYGQEQQTWVSEDGRLMPQSGKPKHVFEHLAFDTTLATNQMLVLTALPERGGTLGHYFFTEPQGASDDARQKLIVIRLAKTRYDDLFSVPAVTEAMHSNESIPTENDTIASKNDSLVLNGKSKQKAQTLTMAGDLPTLK
jgi:hypothetical protein